MEGLYLIRKATPADIPAIITLSLESSVHPRLLVSKDRAFSVARECVSSAAHFAWVSEFDGVIDGVLLALIHPNIFHERSCATVIQYVGDEQLVVEFLRWARKRPVIKRIVFNLENVNPQLGELLVRLGLEQTPVYTETR
jgi:hypothetical protein